MMDFLNEKIRLGYLPFHQLSLFDKIYEGLKNPTDSSLNADLLELFDEIIKGNLDYEENTFFSLNYKEENKDFLMINTATGIKSISILKSLLINELDSNSLIIMDEPEVHLHPEWQVKLAELIVKLSIKGDINFYINSHSPQFIEAIEVYSEKYEINDKTNFYLTKEYDDTGTFDFFKIEKNNMNEIYADLGNPYVIINKERGKNLKKHYKLGDR